MRTVSSERAPAADFLPSDLSLCDILKTSTAASSGVLASREGVGAEISKQEHLDLWKSTQQRRERENGRLFTAWCVDGSYSRAWH